MEILRPSSRLFRVVTIGDSSVGKTSIINQLVNQKFNDSEQSTIGAMFVIHVEEIENTRIEMQIWDTAGQEKFRSLGPIYYRNADAAVVVFDTTQQISFKHLDSWIDAFTEVAGTEAVIIIAGNKSDIIDENEVTNEMAQKYANENGYAYFPTSALTGSGIQEMFHNIALKLSNKIIMDEASKNTRDINRQDDDSECKC